MSMPSELKQGGVEHAKSPFISAPWALRLFDDPSLIPFANDARIVKNHMNTADTFVGVTLATSETIIAWESFYKAPDATSKHGEVLSLLSIGSGVNGHIDTAHGGFLSLILDEALGLAAEKSRPVEKTCMTAYLKVDYKKPVKTPSVLLCRAWVDKAEGKKLYIKGCIEDGTGVVLTTGDSLFIIIDRAALREKL